MNSVNTYLSLFKMVGAERVGEQLGLSAENPRDIEQIYLKGVKRKETRLLHSHDFMISLSVVHVHRERRRGELANTVSK
jgi:hypothetical protein